MSRSSSLSRLLRSPRLAVWLIIYLVGYAALATLVPQEGVVSPSALAAWRSANPSLSAVTAALGLHRAFWSVGFVAPAILLALSTAACAWARTRAARNMGLMARAASADLAARVTARPHETVAAEEGVEALQRVADVADSLGLRVTVDAGTLRATHALWAAWGSPVFHWALVGLFLSTGIGQAVKWEGQLGVPVGHSVTDDPLSYGSFLRGPLGPAEPSTGFTVAVPDMPLEYLVGDVERGHAPLVKLMSGDQVVAERRVYPNSPLLYGPLYFHREAWGLAVVAALETSEGAEVGRRNFLIEVGSTGGTGRLGIEDGMPPESGVSSIRFDVPLDPTAGGFTADVPDDPRVEVGVPGSSQVQTTTLRPGGAITFPGGELTLRVVDVTRYVRLLVVHDPSTPVVYALFVLTVIGCAVALLVHPRILVAVERLHDDGTVVADVVVLSSRVDTLFASRAREDLARIGVRKGES